MAKDNPDSQDYEKIFKRIRKVEAQAYKSDSAQERDYLFESGTADSLSSFLKIKRNPRWWFGAVSVFLDRIWQIGFPDYNKNPTSVDNLLLPFCNLARMLEDRISCIRWKLHFEQLSEEMCNDSIQKLTGVIAKGFKEPFERLLGLLQIVASISKVSPKSINEGMKRLQSAYNNGDSDAGCILAAIHLEGNELSGAIPKNLKAGKAILLDLIKKRNIKAALTMARYCNHEEEFAESYKYAFDALKINPENIDAAVLMAQACLDDPKLLKELEKEENIAQVLALAMNNERVKKIIPFYEVYFSLRGKMKAMSEQEILGSLLQACETAVGTVEANDTLVRVFKATDFEKKFENWIQEHPVSDKNDQELKKDSMSKRYSVAAWIAFLNAQYAFKENKQIFALDSYKKCLNANNMALTLKSNDLSAYCLKAWIHFQEHFANREAGWEGLKSALTRIGVIMALNKLTLDNVPALNVLINKILLVHGNGTYFSGVNGIELIPNPDPIGTVVDQNLEFIKKFKEKHSSASDLKVIKIEV